MDKEKVLELIEKKQYNLLSEEMFFVVEKELTTEELLRYNLIVNEKKKNVVLTWILWAIIGYFGANLIYLGLKDNRLIAFILLVIGWITIYFIIGSFILLGVWLWSAFLNVEGLKKDVVKTKADVYSEMFLNENK